MFLIRLCNKFIIIKKKNLNYCDSLQYQLDINIGVNNFPNYKLPYIDLHLKINFYIYFRINNFYYFITFTARAGSKCILESRFT